MKSLKPCPFCGATEGNLYITSLEGHSDETVVIFCNSCKTIVFIEDNDNEGDNIFTRRKAVQAWNRRAEPVKNELMADFVDTAEKAAKVEIMSEKDAQVTLDAWRMCISEADHG